MTSAALAAVTLGSATTSTSTKRPKHNNQNRKGMKNVTFIHDVVGRGKRIFSNSNCNPTEKEKIMSSVRRADKVIKKAYKLWPRHSFKKWFGTGTDYDNENVKRRYAYAMNYLQDERGYTVMCCKSSRGACGTCRGRVLAYVLSYRGGRVKRSLTHIRICPLAMRQKNHSMSLGMTMFHEVMHVTSAAGDKGYSKRECFRNARQNPRIARLNAAAYVYFAAENGYSRANWLKYAGRAYDKNGQPDQWTNCPSLVRKSGCRSRRGRQCPATCEYIKRQRGGGGAGGGATGEDKRRRERERKERERKERERKERERRERENGNRPKCWVRANPACKKGLRQAKWGQTTWFKDSKSGQRGRSACAARARAYTRYCRTKVVTCWNKSSSRCRSTTRPKPRPRPGTKPGKKTNLRPILKSAQRAEQHIKDVVHRLHKAIKK